MRELLPLLLAVSANSPFLDGRDTGLHSVRTEIFTRTFPRCGVPAPFGDWARYADFVDTAGADRTRSSSRPSSGGACARTTASARSRCGSATPRPRGDESFALAGLISACVAQTALDYDELGYEGRGAPLADREIEENLWRAIRYGAGGRMIDFRAREEVETRAALESVLAWTEPARSQLGIEVDLPDRNGAERAREALAAGASIEEI